MFIAHGEKFRKNAKFILGFFAVIMSISLVGYFTQTGSGSRQPNASLPTVRGQAVNSAEFERMRELVGAEYVVMQGRELRRTPDMQDQLKREAVVQMLIGQQAKAMGIVITEPELLAALRSQPLFAGEGGQFDPEKYRRFTIFLNNYGITEAMFEEVMRL